MSETISKKLASHALISKSSQMKLVMYL